MTKLTGVTEFDFIAVFQRVTRAAVVWRPAVDSIDPAGFVAAVKFVEIADSLDIRGIVGRRKAVVEMDFLVLANPD